jgi:hypothetical protein
MPLGLITLAANSDNNSGQGFSTTMRTTPILQPRSLGLQTLALVDLQARRTAEMLPIIRAAIFFCDDSLSASLSVANSWHPQTLQSHGTTSWGVNTAHLLSSLSSTTVARSAKTCSSVPGPDGVLTFRPRNGKSQACGWPNLLGLASVCSRSGTSVKNGLSAVSEETVGLETRGVNPRSVSIFE